MTITLTIPDDKATMIIDGIANYSGWNAGTGLTKGQWAKAKLIENMKEMAKFGNLATSKDSITTEVDGVPIT